ncbi:MAG: deoxyguanosinetriphosphate triphosphohydrolase [Hyphomicrobium sp.]|nr:deoxyguanosinetriphosphate triphosphohydrolase [Hyphomicrobium sp.]
MPSQTQTSKPDDTGHARYGAALVPGERSLAPYAASAVPSRGRQHPETECSTRSPFQRDRDRILHSTAFRRLTHKTQVFVYHDGDHYRTRLTHSLEVAQIARTIARQLRLDEDLAEALALAHDLGHPPFGHAGERALDHAMHRHGGFDHNAQSLRIVVRLERKYRAFDGLNLTWETLEGLAKHNGPIGGRHEQGKGDAVLKAAAKLSAWQSLEPESYASAEAQVAALSDDIAYLTHDVDDGLRAGLLSFTDIREAVLAGPIARAVLAERGAEGDGRAVFEVTRRMITALVRDVVGESRTRLAAIDPSSPDDIRRAGRVAIAFSTAISDEIARLRAFLFERVYRHPRVAHVMENAAQIVSDLFARYRDPTERNGLPAEWHSTMTGLDDRRQARIAADYLAGQTDRFAISEHRRLFDSTPELR